MADSVYKILLEVENREELKLLQADFNRAHAALVALNAQMKANPALAGQMTAQAQAYAQQLSQLHTKITALQAATKGGILGGGQGTGFNAQGLMQASYLIDDLQYGFSAIVNNIPQLVAGMGGGPGLAGAIGIAAVAVNVLSKHWDEFVGKIKETGPAIEDAFKHAKESKNQEIVSDLEAILKGKSFEQKETEGLMKEYFESGIGPEVVGKVAQAIAASGEGAQLSTADQHHKERLEQDIRFIKEGGGNPGQKQKNLDALMQGINERNVAEAGKLLSTAKSDPNARRRLARLDENVPGTLPKDFVAGMKGLEPEAIKEQDAEIQAKIEEGDTAKWNREMRERKKKKDDALRKKTAAIDKKRTDEDIKTEVRGQQDMLHSQIHDMQERKKKINEETKNKSQTFKDTQSFLSNLQEKALDKIPKEQLEKLKHIDNNIREMKDKIKLLGTLVS